MGWTICTDSFKFADGTVGVPTPFPTSYMSAGTLQRVDFVSGGSSPFVVEKPTIGEWIIGPNAEGSYFSIHVTEYKKGKTVQGNITFWHEPSKRSLYESLGFNGEDGTKLAIGLYYDEDNEKAGFIKYEGTSTGYVETTTSDPGYPNTSKHFYNFLKNNIYVPGASIIVNYNLPSNYDYQYAKIVYKKNSAPTNENDGEYVNILKDETSATIDDLEENNKYYFMIYTDKSESEPKEYMVEFLDFEPVPRAFLTEYNNIFVMPLSNISQPPGGGGWSYGYQQFIDDYLPHYKNYSYIGYNTSPYILDVASATTNKDANMKMSSTKVDMLITPNKELKFRNHTNDVVLDGWCNQLQYRYLASYDCRLVGPFNNDSTDRWADRSFGSNEDLWTFISRNVRFVNVFYGSSWDNCRVMKPI